MDLAERIEKELKREQQEYAMHDARLCHQSQLRVETPFYLKVPLDDECTCVCLVQQAVFSQLDFILVWLEKKQRSQFLSKAECLRLKKVAMQTVDLPLLRERAELLKQYFALLAKLRHKPLNVTHEAYEQMHTVACRIGGPQRLCAPAVAADTTDAAPTEAVSAADHPPAVPEPSSVRATELHGTIADAMYTQFLMRRRLWRTP